MSDNQSQNSQGNKIFLAAMLAALVFLTLGLSWLGLALASKSGSATAGVILREIYNGFGGQLGVWGILTGASVTPPAVIYVGSKISECFAVRSQSQQSAVTADRPNLINSAGVETLADLDRALAGSWRERQPLIHSLPLSSCWSCCGRRDAEDTEISQPSSSHSYTLN